MALVGDFLFIELVIGVSQAAKIHCVRGVQQWMLGDEFTLLECAYGPVLNVIEKAGFGYGAFPNVGRYLEEIHSRHAWHEVPKLPGL